MFIKNSFLLINNENTAPTMNELTKIRKYRLPEIIVKNYKKINLFKITNKSSTDAGKRMKDRAIA